jgi:hypothetical protein
MKALLPTTHPELAQAIAAAQGFAQLIRQRLPDQFDAWLQEALGSSLRELRAFARGIQRDYDAVLAALRLPWSNGLLEGHVNRLKFLKRRCMVVPTLTCCACVSSPSALEDSPKSQLSQFTPDRDTCGYSHLPTRLALPSAASPPT